MSTLGPLIENLKNEYVSPDHFFTVFDLAIANGESLDNLKFPLLSWFMSEMDTLQYEGKVSESDIVECLNRFHCRGIRFNDLLQILVCSPPNLVPLSFNIIRAIQKIQQQQQPKGEYRFGQALKEGNDCWDIELISALIEYPFELEDLEQCKLGNLVAPYAEADPEGYEDSWYFENHPRRITQLVECYDLDELADEFEDLIYVDFCKKLINHDAYIAVFEAIANLEFEGKSEFFSKVIYEMFEIRNRDKGLERGGRTDNHVALLKLMAGKDLIPEDTSPYLHGAYLLAGYLQDEQDLLAVIDQVFDPSVLQKKRLSLVKSLRHYDVPEAVLLALKNGSEYHYEYDSSYHSAMRNMLKDGVDVQVVKQTLVYVQDDPDILSYLFGYITEQERKKSLDHEYVQQLIALIPDFAAKSYPLNSSLWRSILIFPAYDGENASSCLSQYLCDHNVDINGSTPDGKTVFFDLLQESVTQPLIALGANPGTLSSNGQSLYFVKDNPKYSIDLRIRLGTEYDVDINQQNHKGNTALLYALKQWSSIHDDEWIDRLIALGSDVTLKNNAGETALTVFSANLFERLNKAGQEEMRGLILRLKALAGEINAIVHDGKNLMQLAAEINNVGFGRLLIAEGFDSASFNNSDEEKTFIPHCLRQEVDIALELDEDECFYNVIAMNTPLNEANLGAVISYMSQLFTENNGQKITDIKDDCIVFMQFGLYNKGAFERYLDMWGFVNAVLEHPALVSPLRKLILNIMAYEKQQDEELWLVDEECLLLPFYDRLAASDVQYVRDYAEYLVRMHDHCVLDRAIDDVVKNHGYCHEIKSFLATIALDGANQHSMEFFESYYDDSLKDEIHRDEHSLKDFIQRLAAVADANNRSRSQSLFEDALEIIFGNDTTKVKQWMTVDVGPYIQDVWTTDVAVKQKGFFRSALNRLLSR